MTSQPKRRWQFELRTIFLVALIACAYSAGARRADVRLQEAEARAAKAHERAAKVEVLADRMHRDAHTAIFGPEGDPTPDQPICTTYLELKEAVRQVKLE